MVFKSKALPRSITAYIGGRNFAGFQAHVLIKDDYMLVIQSPPSPKASYVHGVVIDTKILQEVDNEYLFNLEKIQTLLHAIEFGKTNWAYMIPRREGGFRLVQKDRPMYEVTCTPWAPLVEERDITITQWITPEERHGLWKGKEVDIYMGWADDVLERVEQMMVAYRALHGLDLTYEVLGHLTRDGTIIGLITEPAYGRSVEFCDRSIVYDAISRVQSYNLLYRTPCKSNIMLSNGKVRFTDLSRLKVFSDHEKSSIESESEVAHWLSLKILFEELSLGPNWITPARTWKPKLRLLPAPTAPEKPFYIRQILEMTSKSLFPDFCSTPQAGRQRQKQMSNAHRADRYSSLKISAVPDRVSGGTRIRGSEHCLDRDHRRRHVLPRAQRAAPKLLLAPEEDFKVEDEEDEDWVPTPDDLTTHIFSSEPWLQATIDEIH
ncbi:hypothetical protein HGRIS_006869 [Hohenbuehelia grisea]|uniref:Fungal-type protein kinase domain-containing protein n=1 Tax=Hohenbuehelia grisea TaxID=104357 RepID=A0ABR3JAE0_9AGAR